jgi:hypothetical protein
MVLTAKEERQKAPISPGNNENVIFQQNEEAFHETTLRTKQRMNIIMDSPKFEQD